MILDREQILNLIAEQIGILMNKTPEIYNGYVVKIEAEEKFDIDSLEENSKTIYVIVNFLEATLPYGQIILPVNFNILSERNSINITQKLFFDYAQNYNLKLDNSKSIRQYYTTPTLSSTFNEEGNGFRSVFSLSASFLITENILDIDKIEYQNDDGTFEELKIIAFLPTYQAQVDSQAFSENESKCISVGMIGSIVFSVSLYPINNELFTKVQNILWKNGSVNTDFKFKITFKNGYESDILNCKLVDYSPTYQLGEIPVASITFCR